MVITGAVGGVEIGRTRLAFVGINPSGQGAQVFFSGKDDDLVLVRWNDLQGNLIGVGKADYPHGFVFGPKPGLVSAVGAGSDQAAQGAVVTILITAPVAFPGAGDSFSRRGRGQGQGSFPFPVKRGTTGQSHQA